MLMKLMVKNIVVVLVVVMVADEVVMKDVVLMMMMMMMMMMTTTTTMMTMTMSADRCKNIEIPRVSLGQMPILFYTCVSQLSPEREMHRGCRRGRPTDY